jgi:hypothetical protein
MNLKKLINNQTISVDDHKWGNGEIKEWDLESTDIHLEKKTKTRIDGEYRTVTIKVPLNSDRPIKIENKEKHESLEDVPRRLKKEIKAAFANETKRENFIKDLILVLKDFHSILGTMSNARQALLRIAKHFEIDLTYENMIKSFDDVIQRYTESFEDKDGIKYYMTVNNKRIKIGDYKDKKELERLHNNDFTE